MVTIAHWGIAVVAVRDQIMLRWSLQANQHDNEKNKKC